MVVSEQNEGRLNTVIFSPSDSNILAVAGYKIDVLFYDIRRPTGLAFIELYFFLLYDEILHLILVL